MTSTNTSILDLDALLDQGMDQVETLPEYVSPAPGVYMLAVDKADIQEPKKPKAGEEAKPPRLRITYRIVSTIQIEGNEPPFPDGSLFSEGFQATEDGLKYYKRRAMAILNVTDLGDAKLRDVMETLVGTEFKAVISIKKSTGTDGKEYENINVRAVHEELPG
jgi:hypothetical protein